jgi:hypothetical protein
MLRHQRPWHPGRRGGLKHPDHSTPALSGKRRPRTLPFQLCGPQPVSAGQPAASSQDAEGVQAPRALVTKGDFDAYRRFPPQEHHCDPEARYQHATSPCSLISRSYRWSRHQPLPADRTGHDFGDFLVNGGPPARFAVNESAALPGHSTSKATPSDSYSALPCRRISATSASRLQMGQR